jgi:hypothetical protein
MDQGIVLSSMTRGATHSFFPSPMTDPSRQQEITGLLLSWGKGDAAAVTTTTVVVLNWFEELNARVPVRH